MTKHKRRTEPRTVGRTGRPLRTAQILIRVEPEQKRSIKAAAEAANLSVTSYLVALHEKGGQRG